MLQDVCSCTKPFGGITVVFGGDFQQTLPVVAKGSREEIVNATLQRSRLWPTIQVRHLRENMRIRQSADSLAFSRWLLDIGHGRGSLSTDRSGTVSIPSHMLCASQDDLINTVYGHIDRYNSMPPPHFFQQRAILAPTNEEIRNLNSLILSRFPGDSKTFSSADSYSFESPTREENDNIPLEFLHGLNPTGLPLAHLSLKIGCPVILLRNIDKRKGLCNGTRGTILQMSNRVLEIHLISGDHAGETALIPRIELSPSLTGLDFAIKLNRRQFPVQLAFAMTINKAQGQTVSHVGVDLRKPVFSHGQLYVALSRATSMQHIHVLLGESSSTTTANVVFPEILL
jgi:PIF1-like helicase/Helicase